TTCQECGYDFGSRRGPAVAPTTRQAATGPAQVEAPHQQIPAGWFPDPHKQAHERYWDGVRWTEQVRGDVAASSTQAEAPEQQIPAGWFPDPHKQAHERYWDGARWTEQVRGHVAASSTQAEAPEQQIR